ncbi:hypothetical protein C3374_17550 [Pantoea sp. PSNIH4]|nr:hypothetical protein PSNIH2_16465 [Pantoea sp. PSNIH2]POU44867.1 hypothetical protein C3380_17755 [Pantoea sp. PSNIH5]POU63668.1 hypothetical protein C3374_17550 [Pantoea sp. PSNIH4]POY66945.1 hypothetical protein C3402_15475 [Pantoea sp. PSNIH3]
MVIQTGQYARTQKPEFQSVINANSRDGKKRVADNHKGYQHKRMALGVVPVDKVVEPASTGSAQGESPLRVIVRACYAETKKASSEAGRPEECVAAGQRARKLIPPDATVNGGNIACGDALSLLRYTASRRA